MSRLNVLCVPVLLIATFAACDISEPTLNSTDDGTETGSGTHTRNDPGDDTSHTDLDSDENDTVQEPRPGVMLGQIEIAVSGWGGQWDSAANIRADFYDSPMRMEAFTPFPPEQHEIAASEAGCVLWLPAQDAQCNPPCDWDEYCGSPGSCLLMPQRVSAGEIVVAAGGKSISIHPADWGYDGSFIPRSAIGAGATISAVAAGADLESFTLETTGISAPTFKLEESNILALVDGRDNVIEFSAGESGKVRLVLNKGWHGSLPEATLICEVDAAAGRLVIPQKLVEAFPSTGGPGLEQHQSWISLISRASTQLSDGPVELIVAYKRNLYPSHGI